MSTLARFCESCGARRASEGDRYCSVCGAPFDRARPPLSPTSAAPLRPRSVWLVGVLNLVTLGLYFPIWMGLTWSEMKRELGDDTMYPVWHALTQLVPIYNLFRIHAHYQTISDLLLRARAPASVSPGGVITAIIIGTIVSFFLGFVALAVSIWALVHGQNGLNAYSRAVSGDGDTS